MADDVYSDGCDINANSDMEYEGLSGVDCCGDLSATRAVSIMVEIRGHHRS